VSLATMVTLLWTSVTSAAVYVTCHDGSRRGRVRQGNLHGHYRLCDLDGACNGACTFSISSVCLSCYLDTQLSPSDFCSPGAAAACKQATDNGPTSSSSVTSEVYAITLTRKRARRKLVRTPREGHIPRRAFVLRCLPPNPGRCAALPKPGATAEGNVPDPTRDDQDSP
jgi:hypothetical protein